MKLFNLALLSLCSLGVLSACSKTKEQFDFSKKSPDEFSVVKRAPLEMPTTLDLPPPRPGATRPQETAPEEQAKAALFGQASIESAQAPTSGEAILLQRTGASNVSADIRDVVDQETAQDTKENVSTFNKILGRSGDEAYAADNVIDPVKERERLMEQSKNK